MKEGNEIIKNLGEKEEDIFNIAWDEGEIPEDWKTRIMIPILKKDDS